MNKEWDEKLWAAINFGWKPFEVNSMSSYDFTMLKRAWNREVSKQNMKARSINRRRR